MLRKVVGVWNLWATAAMGLVCVLASFGVAFIVTAAIYTGKDVSRMVYSAMGAGQVIAGAVLVAIGLTVVIHAKRMKAVRILNKLFCSYRVKDKCQDAIRAMVSRELHSLADQVRVLERTGGMSGYDRSRTIKEEMRVAFDAAKLLDLLTPELQEKKYEALFED